MRHRIGWTLIAFACGIVIGRRVVGIDLTEGQLLVQDWPWFAAAVGFALVGALMTRKGKGAA